MVVTTVTLGVGVRVRSAGLVSCITLGQEHITLNCPAAIAFQPFDRLRYTILTLSQTQIPDALGHTLYIPRATHPIWPTGAHQRRQHRISTAHGVRIIPDRRSTFLQDHSLILHPEKGSVIVLDVAPLKLQRSTACLRAHCAELTHRASDAGGAVWHGEVAPALVESVNHILRAGAHDGVVVVGRVGS